MALLYRMLVLVWICFCGRRMGLRVRPLIRTCMDAWAVHGVSTNHVVHRVGKITSNLNRVERVVMPIYPSPENWLHANERQRNRALRSFANLRKRSVPVYSGPLFVDDDNDVVVQSPESVARRTILRSAVLMLALLLAVISGCR